MTDDLVEARERELVDRCERLMKANIELRAERDECLRLYEQCEEIRASLHADRFELQQLADSLRAERDAALARIAQLEAALAERDDVLMDVLASLTAAVSLLKRGSKKAAPSDRMFDQMIIDYERSIERARGRAGEGR